MSDLTPRRGMPIPRLTPEQFRARFLEQFRDQAFAPLSAELDKLADAAWLTFRSRRKAAATRKAGPGYADPDYELATDWIAAHEAILAAQKRHEDKTRPRILLINGSSRNDHTCPGEISKSWRFVQMAREVIEAVGGIEIEELDLSRLAAEYGRKIYPCKACFSTAASLCHWPCSCYPNQMLGQTQDWMNEIYPMWVAAHGVMIVTPVNWYQTSSPIKLMMDRLVCADGGNPDPTTTHGKHAQEAKELEMKGWSYPRHLEGRIFSVVVHGDTEGTENVRRSLVDWMTSMHMQSAGVSAELDRYIGYWKPYATNHTDLDADTAIQDEVRNAARTLLEAVRAKLGGKVISAGAGLHPPREK
jgi:multimeric flavodoxin WrbA